MKCYECPFKASSLSHKSIFAKKGVVWYLFTTFRDHFFQHLAVMYPKVPIIVGKYFHKEHLAFCKNLGGFTEKWNSFSEMLCALMVQIDYSWDAECFSRDLFSHYYSGSVALSVTVSELRFSFPLFHSHVFIYTFPLFSRFYFILCMHSLKV